MFDCIVLGTGGIGSATLVSAARKGWKVLGIDQFGPAHNHGSSHGQTRMIRTAYFEHPNYVPIVQQAFQKWDELQKSAGIPLIRRTGLLQVGYEDGVVIQGVLKSAGDFGLTIEKLAPEKITERFPLLKPNADHLGVFEEDAGVLFVEKCVAALIRLAKASGAEYLANTKVLGWSAEDDGTYVVRTEQETFRTQRLVVTAGAWSASALDGLGLPLRLIRKQQQWFQSDRVDGHVETGFPCIFVETEERDWFYGMPAIDKLGMKIAEHTGGQDLDFADQLDTELNQGDVDRVQRFVDRHLDFGRSRVIYHSPCIYTMSPDEHFIVDRHPEHSGVAFAAGMSGHGFKFAPMIGEQLVALLEGEGDPNMEFLKLARLRNAS